MLDLVLATLRGEVRPVMSVYDCRQIQSYPTTIQPMRGLVDRIKAMEGKDGILSVSIAHTAFHMATSLRSARACW